MERFFIPGLIVLGIICGGIAARTYNDDAGGWGSIILVHPFCGVALWQSCCIISDSTYNDDAGGWGSVFAARARAPMPGWLGG